MKAAMFCLLFLAISLPALAQTRPDLNSGALMGRTVRIRPSGAARVQGLVARLDEDSIGLHREGALHMLPRAALDTIWVRHDHAGTGAIVGALLGVIPVVASCADTVDECGLVPGIPVLPTSGAGLGALIGWAVPVRKGLYP